MALVRVGQVHRIHDMYQIFQYIITSQPNILHTKFFPALDSFEPSCKSDPMRRPSPSTSPSPEVRRAQRNAFNLLPGGAAVGALVDAGRPRNQNQTVSPYEARRRAREAEALRQRRLANERRRRAETGVPY